MHVNNEEVQNKVGEINGTLASGIRIFQWDCLVCPGAWMVVEFIFWAGCTIAKRLLEFCIIEMSTGIVTHRKM